MNKEIAGFLFQGQEENSYKPVLLERRVEIHNIFRCSSYTAELEVQGSHQQSHLITDRELSPRWEGSLYPPRNFNLLSSPGSLEPRYCSNIWVTIYKQEQASSNSGFNQTCGLNVILKSLLVKIRILEREIDAKRETGSENG